MKSMPNVHVRELPPETLDALREAARRQRRSLNAEIVAALAAHVESAKRGAQFERRLRKTHRRWRERFEDGYPPGLEPETIIRQARDSR
jgi:plasmid stability protein